MTDTVCIFNPDDVGKLLSTLFTDAGGEDSDNNISCALNEISSRIPPNLQLSDDVTVPTYISEEQQRKITSIFDSVTENLGLPPSTEFSNKLVDLTMRIVNSNPSSDELDDVTSPRGEVLGGAKKNKSNKNNKDSENVPVNPDEHQYVNMPQLSLEDTMNLTLTVLTTFASGYCMVKMRQYVGDTLGTVTYLVLDSTSRDLFPEGRFQGVLNSTITYTGKKAMDFLSYIGYGVGNVALKGISVVDEEYGEEINSFNSKIKNAITLVILVIGVVALYHSLLMTLNDIVNVKNNVVVIPDFLWSLMRNSATSLYNRTFLWKISSHVSKAFALFPALDGQCSIGAEGLEVYAGETGFWGYVGKAASAVNTLTLMNNTQCYVGLAAAKYYNYKLFKTWYKPPLYVIQWAILHLTNKDIFYYPNVALDKLPLGRIDGVRKRIFQTPEEIKNQHSNEKSVLEDVITEQNDEISAILDENNAYKNQLSAYERQKSLRPRLTGGKSRRRKVKKQKKKTRKHHKRKTRKSGKKKARKHTTKKR